MRYRWTLRCCCSVFVLLVGTVQALSSSSLSTTQRVSSSKLDAEHYLRRGWTQVDIDIMEEQSAYLKKSLESHNTGSAIRTRPIRIQAKLLDVDSSLPDHQVVDLDEYKDGAQASTTAMPTTKFVHFQRHGQGYHNLLYEVVRDCNGSPDLDSTDPTKNPWVRPELVDSPLTAIGRNQCNARRHEAARLNPQLVVVSPLLRAIQTAKLSFVDHYKTKQLQEQQHQPIIPWIVHEECREDLGTLVCNKRRRLSEIQMEFPEFEYYGHMTEEDLLWEQCEGRESHEALSNRVYNFLTDFLAKRRETEIAVIGHSAWLFEMCNTVLDCGTDETLSQLFLNGEIRSMCLTFEPNPYSKDEENERT